MAASRFQAQRSLGVYTGGQADLKGKGGKLVRGRTLTRPREANAWERFFWFGTCNSNG